MAESDPGSLDDDPQRDSAMDADLQRLEDLLGQLKPTGPRTAFVHRLEAKLAAEQEPKFARGVRSALGDSGNHPVLSASQRRRRRLLRAIPLGIAALVTLTGIVLLHRVANLPGPPAGADSLPPPVALASATQASVPSAPGTAALETIREGYLPVSSESSLREIEAEEIVVIDGMGPMRPVTLHFEAAQCWIDPQTNTSVQVILPWQELVFYPVTIY